MKDEVIIKATKETTKETIESIVIKQGVTFGEFKKEYGNDEKLKKDEVRDEVIGVVLRAALDSNDICWVSNDEFKRDYETQELVKATDNYSNDDITIVKLSDEEIKENRAKAEQWKDMSVESISLVTRNEEKHWMVVFVKHNEDRTARRMQYFPVKDGESSEQAFPFLTKGSKGTTYSFNPEDVYDEDLEKDLDFTIDFSETHATNKPLTQ